MTMATNKNTHITVFRGGKVRHKDSIKEGKDVFAQLEKNGITFSDIYVDEDGIPIKDGVKADTHYILSNSDAYIDTTGTDNLDHHRLAKKMGLKKLFSEEVSIDLKLDRENIYRILRQNNILVPDTYVIRKNDEDFLKTLKEIWSKFHTPYLVRTLTDTNSFPSKLIKGFNQLMDAVVELHNKGHDVHVLNYKSVPTYSVAVIPNFRGEEYYTPMIVETLLGKYEVPNKESKTKIFTHGSTEEKGNIYNLAKRVAKALDIEGPVCIDIIDNKGKREFK